VLNELRERVRDGIRQVDVRHVAPVRGGLWRARRAQLAENAARLAQRTTTEAIARERSFRKEFAELASRLTPYIAVEKDESLYILPTRQKFGVSRFAWWNWKEHRHLERALAMLDRLGVELPGAAFVDVGANIGTTTVQALRRFPFTTGYAFEPEPGNFRLLRVNLAANDLDHLVRPFNVAVSSRSGTGSLALRSEIGSKHRLVGDGFREDGALTVPLLALDELVQDGRLPADDVGLLWLDIEGHELEALQGARTLLDRSIPIVMEFDPRVLDGSRLESFRSLLAESYTGIVDLRSGRPDEPEVLSLSALEEVARRYPDIYTDLLVFRAPA
jgi:FkbM family methyltransferase